MRKILLIIILLSFSYFIKAQEGVLSLQNGMSMKVQFKTFDENFCYYNIITDSTTLKTISKTKITDVLAFQCDSNYIKSVFQITPIWKRFYRQLPPAYLKDALAKYEVFLSIKNNRNEEYCEILVTESIISSGKNDRYRASVDFGNGYEKLLNKDNENRYTGIPEILNFMNNDGWVYIDRSLDIGQGKWNCIITMKKQLKIK